MNQRKPYRGLLRFSTRELPCGCILLWVLVGIGQFSSHAGGSGLNVLVVANQNSSNSLEVANYYLQQREVPPEQLLRISWPGGNTEWTQSQFQNHLLNPLLAFVAGSSRSNQIQYVVLSMDIPFRVIGSRANSTTSALFYGFKTGTKNLQNSYASSEARFAEEPPTNTSGYAFLTTMITAGSLEQAITLVDQGVGSDGSYSAQTVWLDKSSDPVRNRRHLAFDNAVFNARLCTGYHLKRTNGALPPVDSQVLGWQTGLANFTVEPSTFVPGAIADSLTSFGGVIFGTNNQTSLLEFIHAGAAGSYGTVVEPQLVLEKFPDPMVYYYQSRGFSLAECYYQSLEVPLEGLVVAEPLAAPHRTGLEGGWTDLEQGATLVGITNLSLAFSAFSTGKSIERVDLFLNGLFHQTLTNIIPAAGNRLTISLDGYPVDYEVSTNARLGGIASDLAALLNDPARTNYTRVLAAAYGDRVELQSIAPVAAAGTFDFVDAAGAGSSRQYLAVLHPDPIPTSLASLRPGTGGTVELEIRENYGIGYVIEASPNLAHWQPLYTNAAGGPMTYVDTGAGQYASRFYRLSWPPPPPPPRLEALGADAVAGFTGQVAGTVGRPYLVQASGDLVVWSDVVTNLLGGDSIFTDSQAGSFPGRYYRTRSGDPADYSQVTILGATPEGGNIVRVHDSRQGDTVVWGSSNGRDWAPIYSHQGSSPDAQLAVAAEQGAAEMLSTSLVGASPVFLPSEARGRRKVSVNGQVLPGSFLVLSVRVTSGTMLSVAVTNNVGTNLMQMTQLLVDAINASPDLQAADGLAAEDLIAGAFGAMEFNLYARTPGLPASGIEVSLAVSPGLTTSLSAPQELDENLSDLRSRNHLFVRSGLRSLAFDYPLDTTLLPDGFHELTAVAYEGSHVHSQTHASVQVRIRNSPLEAWLTLEGANTNRLVTDTLQFTVTANTNTVNEILLWSTGGFLSGATNQAQATFNVAGTFLGTGQHPFFATLTTTNGTRYRTETLCVDLLRP